MTQLLINFLIEKIAFLEPIVKSFNGLCLHEKITLLNQNGFTISEKLTEEEEYLSLCLQCIGQWEMVKNMNDRFSDLLSVDQFYSSIGGIIGYHLMALKYLKGKENKEARSYLSPKTLDLRKYTKKVREKVFFALKHIASMTEIYPVGGAADRLHLVDEKTEKLLPAAKLPFFKKGLLKLLIEDVQAREYLHFKIFNKICQIPICMMTSKEKNNHAHVIAILEENNWFNRDKKNFFLFCQPSVPVLDEEGNWCLENKSELKKKPGGHGVLWKMLLEKNLFPILKTLGKTKALIRQINNPIAGIDYGLLAFMGHGLEQDSEFGFIGCDRLKGAKEGINVLVEKQAKTGYSYFLSNIEYCDRSISSMNEGDLFLSNTNILFCDLEKIKQAIIQNPFPGILINFKEGTCYEKNRSIQKKVARLEATMQNISDSFYVSSKIKLSNPSLNTFVAHGDRLKTISPAKKALNQEAFIETPEKAFYDYQKNAYLLLKDHCGFTLPDMFDIKKTSFDKPAFIFLYHAALGPLYSIISQKLNGGALSLGSEVLLEISELYWENVYVDGSFQILSSSPLGEKQEGKLIYSNFGSKVFLKNVKVQNQGIDFVNAKDYWRCNYKRKESLILTLGINAEFHAENITLKGSKHFIVKENTRLILKEENGALVEIREKLAKPTWYWQYSCNDQFDILLNKKGV